jgi:AraC family transcriptional regulator
MFVLGGYVADQFGTLKHECPPASLLIRPAGAAHSHHYGRAGARCFVIEIESPESELIELDSKPLDRVTWVHAGVSAALAIRLYREFNRPDSAADLAAQALLLELLSGLSGRGLGDENKAAPPQQPRWLTRAIDLLHAHYREPLSLAAVAKEVSVHPAHLAQVFRRQTGCTVGQYIRRLRLEFAIRELSASETPLTDIALTAGFYDQSHFTHTFKRYTGMSPIDMRTAFLQPRSKCKTLQLYKPR